MRREQKQKTYGIIYIINIPFFIPEYMFCIFVVDEQGADAKGEKGVATTAQDNGVPGKYMKGEVPHWSPDFAYVWLSPLRKLIGGL